MFAGYKRVTNSYSYLSFMFHMAAPLRFRILYYNKSQNANAAKENL